MKRLQLFVMVSSPAATAGGPCWEGAMVCMCRCVCTVYSVQVCDVCICVCTSVCRCVSVCIQMCMCVCECVQVCKCVYTDVCVQVCAGVCKGVFVYRCLCMRVQTCTPCAQGTACPALSLSFSTLFPRGLSLNQELGWHPANPMDPSCLT